MKWMGVVVLALCAGPAVADKPAANKKAADAAERWLRFLGPAADTKQARAMTADSLTVQIHDGEAGHDKCNGSFDKAKIQATLDCMLSTSAALLEYDFAVAKPKDLAKLPAAIAKYKAKIDAAAKTSLMMIHDFTESGAHEVAIIALVKGKSGRPVVSALWLAIERGGDD
jgi:hypothetical protein